MGDDRKEGQISSQGIACEALAAGAGPAGCTRARDYVSQEEEEILRALRGLKEQARSLTARIKDPRSADWIDNAETQNGASRPGAVTAGMAEIRKAWLELEARLKKANARKLALLGHGPWQDAMPEGK